MPKACSYVRFSTSEQAKGDRLRRQPERSKKYADDHGLVLDTSLDLLDQELSGETGENQQKGALGVFIRPMESGIVPSGSVLIVEILDRLSRESLLAQMTLLGTLINAGIMIVHSTIERFLTRNPVKGSDAVANFCH